MPRRSWPRALGFLLVATLLAVGSTAGAWEAVAVPVDGTLRAGEPGAVWVAVLDDQGQPVMVAPQVAATAGQMMLLGTPTPPGVWPYGIVPDISLEEVALTVSWEGRRKTLRLAVAPARSSRLVLGQDILADARDETLSFMVSGSDLPPAEQLQVITSVGSLASITSSVLGLKVVLDVPGSGVPDVVVVGVRDARRTEPPAWAAIRRKARLTMPIQTEADAQVWLDVGERRWGPVRADAEGMARLVIDQLPEDERGVLRVADASGNETIRDVALIRDLRPVLLALPAGPRLPGEEPPTVFLYGADGFGRSWRGEPPSCRTPRTGDLPVLPIGDGQWVVSPPVVTAGEVWDVRLRCSLGDVAEADFNVPLAEGVPVRLALRVWPETLSTNFPVADVQVTLQNAVGERVEVLGEVSVSAQYGTVLLGRPAGSLVRGEYQGEVAAEVGEDTLVARWEAPPGDGPPDRIRLVVEEVPQSGSARLWVRVLDDVRRPVGLTPLEVRTVAGKVAGVTDERGWALVVVPLPPGPSPVRVDATAGGRSFAGLVVRGTRGRSPLDRPDLETTLKLVVDPGRIATVELDAEPRLLRPGPRAVATVTARFLDRADRPVLEGLPTVTVSEGSLTPLESDAEGLLRWRYVPPPGFRARQVHIVARDEVLDVEGSTTLEVRPAPVAGYFGGGGGFTTNFGALVAGTATLDGGVRIHLRRHEDEQTLTPSRLFLFTSAGWYVGTTSISTDVGVRGEVQMNLFPVSVGLELRQEYPAQAFWLGIGGQFVGWSGSQSFDDQLWLRRGGMLAPGLALAAGYGVRVPAGEVFVELRGSTVTSPGGDAMLSGPVGGLAAVLGYRLLFSSGGRDVASP